MYFNSPLFVLAALLVAGFIVLRYWMYRRRPPAAITFSATALVPEGQRTWRTVLAERLFWLRVLAALAIVIGLMRPQAPLEESKLETEGIDIVLAVDVSGSMLAEDFSLGGRRVNRLTAVKAVVQDFIKGRSQDRIALVAFASRAYTVCPLTLDYGWLLANLERLEVGLIEDGTAIGSGISSALNRIKSTKAKGKVVIVLTDGRNNAGNISPTTAADAARALKIKVYTIGAGGKGLAPYPVKDFFGNTVYQPVKVDIDESTLEDIATKTGAQYFRATDTESLKQIYKEIDRQEKTPIEERGYLEYKELFPWVVVPALGLILLELVLGATVARRVP